MKYSKSIGYVVKKITKFKDYNSVEDVFESYNLKSCADIMALISLREVSKDVHYKIYKVWIGELTPDEKIVVNLSRSYLEKIITAIANLSIGD